MPARRHLAFALLLVLAASALPLTASAQITIATQPITAGSFMPVYNFPNAAVALGQTFATPDSVHTQLDHFEFRMAEGYGGYPLADFNAYLLLWNSSTGQLSGAPLWTSALQNSLDLPPPSDSTGTIVGFDTGGIDLQPGQSYIALLFDSTVSAPYSRTGVGYNGGTYFDGDMVVFHNATGSLAFADLYTTAERYGNDLAFGATFSAPESTPVVPEPAAPAAVLALALCAALIAFRIRQQHHAARLPAAGSSSPLPQP